MPLLFGLVFFGQIRMRKTTGHREVAKLVSKNHEIAA